MKMEMLMMIWDIIILGLITIAPILIFIIINKYKIKKVLILYTILGFIVLGLLWGIAAWWNNESNLILLKHYGYNIDGMNYDDFYGNVLPENLEKVKKIETNSMGIGRPLKAIFGFIGNIPYLIIVAIGYRLIEFIQRRRKRSDRV